MADEEPLEEEPPDYESILTSIKKLLGIEDTYTQFDQEIMMHINSVFTTLFQLGVGPVTGFKIESKTAVWSDFFGDRVDLEQVKSYMYLRIRLLFDAPQNGYLVTSMQTQIKEHEWRMCE